jgi:hypothetical protein
MLKELKVTLTDVIRRRNKDHPELRIFLAESGRIDVTCDKDHCALVFEFINCGLLPKIIIPALGKKLLSPIYDFYIK